MNILVTAGNTQSPIDRVRAISNIFTGRTGAQIAKLAHERGHSVMLLTSHPDPEMPHAVQGYRTFDELEAAMSREISSGRYDAIVHAAAVNDYHVIGTYAKDGDTFVDVSAGKIKSHHAELWLRMVPAPKLVDKIRRDWGFTRLLVKFKLEVGVSETELLEIAERSRLHSGADLMVANTLEGMHQWAYVGAGEYARIPRADLAATLFKRLEQLYGVPSER